MLSMNCTGCEAIKKNVGQQKIMVIFKCYFSREHIALLFWENGANIELGKKQQIKCTVHDAK